MGERGRGDGQVVAYSAVDSHQEGAERGTIAEYWKLALLSGPRDSPKAVLQL